MAHTRIAAIKEFFSTPDRPVINQELMVALKADKVGWDKIGDDCIKVLDGQEKES